MKTRHNLVKVLKITINKNKRKYKNGHSISDSAREKNFCEKRIKIYQFNLAGNLVNEYDCIRMASEALKITQGRIILVKDHGVIIKKNK